MKCAHCSADNTAGMKFCGACGESLPRACARCGFANPAGFKFCGGCGSPLADAAADSGRETPVPDRGGEAERRQLTVMFCDLVGSTALSERLDPEELRDLLREYHQLSAAAVERFEGHVAQYLGDGLLVYFGYPRAHEDDARRAVHTGLEICHELEDRNRRAPGVRLEVRIGIHTGSVVAGEIGTGDHREQLALGKTPNVAARLQGLAVPGTVVLSEATRHLVEGLFDLEPLGAHQLKGTARPTPLYRALRASDLQSRFELAVSKGLSTLVGRDRELDLLRQRFERSAEGDGQAVLLAGDAGIGKSRLVHLFKESPGVRSGRLWLCRCSAYASDSAFFPLIQLLEDELGLHPGDAPADKLSKLEAGVEPLDLAPAEAVPLLADLLSIPLGEGHEPAELEPQRAKELTVELLLRLLRSAPEGRPVIVVFEDLHWSDPSTLELLGRLIAPAEDSRLFCLLTYRPSFEPPWPAAPNQARIALTRLDEPHVEAMVADLARDRPLPAEVVRQIVERADGVPLFVEELTQMVLESGWLGEDDAHSEEPASRLIPSTLQDSLMARLDRLSTVKELAQLGAVLGREFSFEMLRAVSPWSDEELRHSLERLLAAGLLYQQRTQTQTLYVFKHALIRDAAYNSLLRRTRMRCHRRIAEALEASFPEVAEARPELVAHHYTEARVPERAAEHWQRAGRKAKRRFAMVEAIRHLSRALDSLAETPRDDEARRRELDLLISLGSAFQAAKGFAAPEVEETYLRALELSSEVNDPDLRFTLLSGLGLVYQILGDYEKALGRARQHLELARERQEPERVIEGHLGVGTNLFFSGDLAQARRQLDAGMESYSLYEKTSEDSPLVDAKVGYLLFANLVHWEMGFPDQARDRCAEAVAQARQLSNPFVLAYSLSYEAMLHCNRRDPVEARRCGEEVVALSTEHGFPFWMAFGSITLGWALTCGEGDPGGVEKIEHGLDVYRESRSRLMYTYLLSLLADAHRVSGSPRPGLEVVRRARAIAEEGAERYWLAELLRLEAELELLGDDGAEVEPLLARALDVAREQEARSLELRVAVSLARWSRRRPSASRAKDLLRDVYGSLTEGFATPDLVDAKDLLDEQG